MLVPLVALAALLAVAPVAVPGDGVVDLPRRVGTIPVFQEVLRDRPERLRISNVPGRLRNDERLVVSVAPDGTPVGIDVVQRIVIDGTGDYVIWERAAARSAEPLDDTPPPVLRRSAVVWQGYSPGRRELAARIELDPAIEAARLPLTVALSGAALNPDGTFAADGTVVVRLTNATGRPASVEAGDAPAAVVGPLLDTLRAAAAKPDTPPIAGREDGPALPVRLAGSRESGVRAVRSYAPLRVTGTIRVAGSAVASVTGPATSPLPGGAAIEGVLSSTAEFAVTGSAGGRLELDLGVVPSLDPRTLTPPAGAASWTAWARSAPAAPARAAALDLLVDTALATARIDEYRPYLGHHGAEDVTTEFRYRLAVPESVTVPRPPLRPRPVPIALTVLGVLAAGTAGAAAWRRS